LNEKMKKIFEEFWNGWDALSILDKKPFLDMDY
jgi:hypothetical protein